MATRRRPQKRAPYVPRFHTLAAYLASGGDSQQSLAAKVGVSQAHISRIAKGHAVPTPALAVRLAAVAQIPLDSFTRVYLACHSAEPLSARE
jgi:transcriptional regulator with XRE-family HTH domain